MKTPVTENLSIRATTGSQMELFIKAAGRMGRGMEREPRFGLMARGMKDSGRRTKRMGRGSSGMLMGISLKESGKMIKLMGKGLIRI